MCSIKLLIEEIVAFGPQGANEAFFPGSQWTGYGGLQSQCLVYMESSDILPQKTCGIRL